VVLYGDMIKDFREAIKMVDGSKHILVVGTSFYTSTVNDLVYRAKLLDIGVDVINQSAETELSKYLKKMFG
jgi:NAD-dependent deacetylase